jgi:hypothetical protein
MTIAHLVTHSGGFHADELMSSVILTRLFPQARILRTRDEVWITPAPDRVIYDVGRDHNLERLIFNHHQKNPPQRDHGQPYSSFGLIWRHFGRDYPRALITNVSPEPTLFTPLPRPLWLLLRSITRRGVSSAGSRSLAMISASILSISGAKAFIAPPHQSTSVVSAISAPIRAKISFCL